MEELIAYIIKFYLTKILLWISVGAALITTLKIKPKEKLHLFLLIYLALELCLGLFDNVITPNKQLSSTIKSYYTNYTNIVICILEFNFFSHLHDRVFDNSKRKRNKILRIILFSFAAFIFSYTFMLDNCQILRITYLLGSVEFLLIFFLSTEYFIKVTQAPSSLSLFDKGSFWCFLGSILYCSISAPFYIVGPNFPIGHKFFDALLPALLYYLPYSILFFCISIALKCKTPIWS